jgi:hypothetical protein
MKTCIALTLAAAISAPGLWAQSVASSFPITPATTGFGGGLEFDCTSGIVWVVDETNDLITAYDTIGVLLKGYPAPIPPGATAAPQPIGVGLNSSTGMLWIGDEAEYVYEFDPLTGVTTGVSWSTLPAVTDVSGVAVDAVTGNIFVSQDSGTRVIVEFSPTGAVVSTINLTGTGSMDPDGLAYDWATGLFYLGDDTGDRVYEVDRTGTTLNSWGLAAFGISPEGVGIDPTNGLLYVADGSITRRVYAVSGIVPVSVCVPSPPVFYIAASTTGVGDARLSIANVPAGTFEGWTFISLDTTLPVGTGPIFGVTPDATTFAILTIAPVANPGDVLHWTSPVAGVFPATALTFPAGTFSAFSGTSWDLISLAVGPSGLTPTFNVSRVTW